MKIMRIYYIFIYLATTTIVIADGFTSADLKKSLSEVSHHIEINSKYSANDVIAYNITVDDKSQLLYLKKFESHNDAHKHLMKVKLRVTAGLKELVIGDALVLLSNPSTRDNTTFYGVIDEYFFQISGANKEVGMNLIDVTQKTLSNRLKKYSIEQLSLDYRLKMHEEDSPIAETSPPAQIEKVEVAPAPIHPEPKPSTPTPNNTTEEAPEALQEENNTILYIVIGLVLAAIGFAVIRKKKVSHIL